MNETGTITTGIAATDPYINIFAGIQIAKPLSITIRQTAEVSNPLKDPNRFFPGIDAKLRLAEETEQTPAIAIGITAATGHTRTSGEYIAASKRFGNFDFTAGLGWGRYGSALQIDNPLKSISSHFSKNRNLDSEIPNEPSDWFTGDSIGVFGGVEYFTPLKGLSLKADIGADRYEAERAAFNFDAPAPWSIGANYNWQTKHATIDTSIAAQGINRVMARLAISQNLKNWFKPAPPENTVPMAKYRTNTAFSNQHIEIAAERDKISLQSTTQTELEIQTTLTLSPHHNTPAQIRNAAIHIANTTKPSIETITITPVSLGIQGPAISLQRTDLENAIAHNQGSAEEIWHGSEIIAGQHAGLTKRRRIKEVNRGILPFKLTLDEQISLAEEDSGILHRTSIISQFILPRKFGYLDSGASIRLNIADNLDRLDSIRPRSALPVRSDISDFTDNAISLDTAYTAFTHSPRTDLHISGISGYLEEMYAGAGGEILYRPLNSRFAIGAETYLALKRDPNSTLALNLTGDSLITGHINAWYDVPNHDIVLTAKTGRFLAEDLGIQLGFEKNFKSGAKLEGNITLSNTADFDLFGGTTHADHMMRLTLPLGGIKHLPDYARARITSAPFGRDIGQSINKPLSLYAQTEPFSMSHIIRNWDDITP